MTLSIQKTELMQKLNCLNLRETIKLCEKITYAYLKMLSVKCVNESYI